MEQLKQIFGKMTGALNAFLANPFVYMLWHAALGGVTEYAAEQATNHIPLTTAGLEHAAIGAVVGAAIGFARKSTNPTNQQVADIVAKVMTDKGIIKSLLFLVMFGFCSVSFAGPLSGISGVPAGGEDDLILAPIGALEFNPTTANNYGLAISESFAFANVLPGKDDKHVVISPYAFLGVFGAANIGQWVATNGGAAWSIDYGLMIGLPKLDDGIPEVAFSASWNTIERGDAKLMINVAFPADLLPSLLVHRL